MLWSCKFCTFASGNQRILIRHYKVKHGQYGRSCQIPCIYLECPCSFRTHVALKCHLVSQHSLELTLDEASNLESNLDDDVDEDSVKQSLASLFLRMQTVLHVYKPAIQEIAEELYQISLLAQDSSKRSVRSVLQQH